MSDLITNDDSRISPGDCVSALALSAGDHHRPRLDVVFALPGATLSWEP
jgi:hypothetical protein